MIHIPEGNMFMFMVQCEFTFIQGHPSRPYGSVQSWHLALSHNTSIAAIIPNISKVLQCKSCRIYICWTLCWLRNIVVRTPVTAGELSLSCARLMAGRVTACDHFVGKASAISQPTRPTQPAIPPGSVK